MPKAMLTDRRTQVRFARFLVVGATAYGVQVGTMTVFLMMLTTNLAFTLSFLCSTFTHYLLNRFWALPSERADVVRQAKDYVGVAALSFLINFSIFHLCLDVFGFGKLWSTAIAVPPSTAVVFLLLNYRVFRAKKPTPSS
ncbi:MAG: GtrA family protein [Verrucomicrobia bacterium]|nr:GtrA family protein [Verrucomicrobiota bacterium]